MSFMDWFSNLTGQMGTDMAIDLGTANTLVAMTGEGIVINEPSVVAIEKSTHRVLAVGHEAKNMINHTPEAFSAEHPLKDGVIADYDVTEAMLSAFINKAAVRKYPWQAKPRIVICIPCGATSVEKRAVFEAAIQAGARQAYLIEEPMAAAMGADLPVTEPTGSMVVDIGGGTTEVAVISLGGIVTSSSLRLAGNRMDETIAMHLRDLLGIKIGERTAEVIKIKIGSILPFEDGRERDMIISGQDVLTEQPKEVTIQSEDVRQALQAPCEEMVVHIKETFKKTNPDLASDIIQNGIITTVGLAAKNAILIVEFARELHREGKPLMRAAVEAARLRLRPIIMTSMAFVLGVVPLAIATGASSGSQHSIGTSVVGGTLAGTFLAIFFVPLFFYVIGHITERFGKRTPAAEAEEKNA